MKRAQTLVFILTLAILITCVIACASAATYSPVGPLKVGRVRQDDNGGDCFRCSVATVEAYALGSYSYGGYSNTYSYGNDYVWSSDPVWRHLDALGGVSGLYNLPIPLERQSGLSLSQMLSLAYDKLREGSPVAIWAPRVGSTNVGHASIIIGYNGNSSQLSASDFTIMEVKLSGTSWWSNSVEYFNKYAANPQKDSATGWPMSCYVTLDSWISYCSLQSSFSAVYIPKKQVAPPAPTITTDKSAYTVGDTVTITCGNTELSTAQWLTFYYPDTQTYIYNQDCTGQFTFQFKLEKAGRYDIYYQTSNAAGISPQTRTYITVFRTTAPETPTLALSCTNPFKVQLKLQTNAVVDGFEVERTDLLTNETVTLNVSNEKLGTDMTYVDSGLQSEHTYSYRVRAFNNVEGSVYPGSYSDAQTVQTISQYPDPSQPAFIEVGTDGIGLDRGDFYCLIPPQIVKKWGIRLNEPDGNVYEFTYLCGKDYFCEDALEAKFGTYLDHRLQCGKQSIVFWYVDWQGVTHEAEPYEFTTYPTTVQTPTNFRVTAVTGSSVTLSWDHGSSDVNEYWLYRALNIGTSVEYEAVAHLSSSDVSYTDTGLLDGMDYLYYLRARSAHDAIAETDPITVTTTSTAKPADSGFESVYAQNVTTTNAELIANIPLTYVKFCGFDFGTDPNQMTGKSESGYKNVLLINYDLNKWYGQLTPGTRYYYRFWYETSSETIVSGLHSFYTVPSAPVLQSVEQDGNSMKLTWKPNGNAIYYYIYRSEDGGEMKFYVCGTRKKGDTMSYNDTNVKRGVQYSYQVRAVCGTRRDGVFDAVVTSAASDANTVAAPAFTYVERPSNVTAAYADQKITVSWTAGEKCDSYLIERSLSFSYTEPVGTVDGSTFSFTDTTAQPGNTYRYSVRGICGSDQSMSTDSDYVDYPAPEATEIKLSAAGTVHCRVGDRLSAEYTVYPLLDELQEVRWTSSAEDVVSVDGAGVLTANKEGTSRITAIATDGSGCSASFTLKVDGSKGVFKLPAALTTVESGAFAGNTQMTLLVLSDQPELTVLSGAFEDCYRLSTIYAGPNATSFQEDSFPTQNRLTFCCARGSYAYQYAIRNGFNYLLMQ